MLPDLRIVIIAVISTFLLTVGVGFYTSSRLMSEQRMARSDSFAAQEDSPINRIALNWPEPVQQTTQLDLDFAVTLNGSRNPVRDITNETRAELKPPPADTTAVDTAATNHPPSVTAEAAVKPDAPARADEPGAKEETVQNGEAAPEPAQKQEIVQNLQPDQNEETRKPAVKSAESVPAEEPASVQAVQEILTTAYEIVPPTAGLSLAMKGTEAVAAPATSAQDPIATALIVPTLRPDETKIAEPKTEAQKDGAPAQAEKPVADVAAKSICEADPETTGMIAVGADVPIPQAKPVRATHTPKKATVKKRAKKPLRRASVRPAAPPAPALGFPFNLFVAKPSTDKPKP